MPQIIVEGWRGGNRPPQCHRCQAFGHASTNCHRPPKCVRCAGGHLTRDCAKTLQDTPTCANCGQTHSANDRNCKVYKSEARKRGIIIPPPRPRVLQRRQGGWEQTYRPATGPHTVTATVTTMAPPPPSRHQGPTTLAPPANPPTERGQVPHRRRKRRFRGARSRCPEPAAASTPQPRPNMAGESEPISRVIQTPAPPHTHTQNITQALTRSAPSEPVQTATQDYVHVLTKPAEHTATPVPTRTAAPTTTDDHHQLLSHMTAPAAARAPTEVQVHDPTPTRMYTTARCQRSPQQPTGTAAPDQSATKAPTSTQYQHPTNRPCRRDQRPGSIPRPGQCPTQTPSTIPPQAQPHQGEARSNPDVMVIVRVVMEALMTGFTAYLQGNGIMPAIMAGMAVVTRYFQAY
ncbi:jg25553 [Pararge aegeria aegeria]|uniref:Jg25553 protein n=1 Tax=Pararge aegeria aegeria TaxID=348720 RepID=A0A8S4QPU2_9NEOP|nr:jg25553 [Pararge aegeria aegeria]